ncbi:MAG: pyridoxine 5'-phosphate synthase [Gammaproteobacteria bacterium]
MKVIKRTKLGVNIDHIATLRQARGTSYPDPIFAAKLAEQAGADNITCHLREDRRHIQDRDIELISNMLEARFNFEMAATEQMINIALHVKPNCCCIVPEKREELTTEGGLDVIKHQVNLQAVCNTLIHAGIEVSFFVDPDLEQIEAAIECGVPAIEIHTGDYAQANTLQEQERELKRIKEAAVYAKGKGLIVNAGHGLHYHNVEAIAAIPELNELNIGHAIIARAVFVGLEHAVKEMKQLIHNAANQ